jgi:hypothetical protein
MRNASRHEAAQTLATILLLALGVAAIVVAAWSLTHGGIGWDSRPDTFAELDTRSVHSSWSLARAYDAVPFTSEFYGVFLYQFSDVLHTLATGATQPLKPDSPATYVYQGIANLILSVTSVTALALALAAAFRSVLAAAFGWALTLSTPLWLGMSHVDFKDLPVAAGLTLVTAGLILGFTLKSPLRASVAGAILAGSGGAIALGTRAGSLVLLVALTSGSTAIALIWAFARRRPRVVLPLITAACSALICALAFTWATNPIARIDMLRWLVNAVGVARSYPGAGLIRVAGVNVLSTDLPLWYVPAWVGAQLPVLTLVAVVGGLTLLVVVFIRRRSRIGAPVAIPLVPIVLQALVLPAGIVLSGAVLYDGIRQILFMVPGLIAIAAVALGFLDRSTRGRRRRLRMVVPVGAVIIVTASLAASVRWAPYAYAFINPIAGRYPHGRSWELDYWGVSAKEGVRRLQALGYSPVYVEPTWEVAIPYGATAGAPTHRRHSGLYVFVRQDLNAAQFGCKVIFTIKRDGHVLGEGASCARAARTLTKEH